MYISITFCYLNPLQSTFDMINIITVLALQFFPYKIYISMSRDYFVSFISSEDFQL